jgi:hypothetical protein
MIDPLGKAEVFSQRDHGGEEILAGEDIAEKTERERHRAEGDRDDFDDADEEKYWNQNNGHHAGESAFHAEEVV